VSTTATVELPTSQGTGLPLPRSQWNTYTRATTEVLQRDVEVGPDGTGSVHVLLAGTCCSARCAIMFLAKHDANTAGEQRLQELANVLPQGPCQAASERREGTDEEPF
jgi:hypothetical protein